MLRVFRLEIVSNMCETVPLLQRRQLDIAVISVPGLAATGTFTSRRWRDGKGIWR